MIRTCNAPLAPEALDRLWHEELVLIEATGKYASGHGSFSECWARPVPEWAGGVPGTWEVLVLGDTLPGSLAHTADITRAKVLYRARGGAL